MKITFWGTRGSIPSPGFDTVKYGGNTPCLSLELDDGSLVILDAGTGIRKLGLELMKRKQPLDIHIFITHSHWDHIQGIPFFVPLYVKNNIFKIISTTRTTRMLKKTFEDLLKHPYFPVSYDNLASKISFHKPEDGRMRINNTEIEIIDTNHPDITSAYKFTDNGKSFVYMTDNEIEYPNYDKNTFAKLCAFCEGAHLLVHDTMYTKEEYLSKKGWGHTCFDTAIDLAAAAGVKKLALFHYEPEYSDEKLDSLVEYCRNYASSKTRKVDVMASKEGLSVTI